METGEVVANIQVLNERFRFAEIDELVARKRAGAEKMALDDRDMDEHGGLLDRLEAKLQEALRVTALLTPEPFPLATTTWQRPAISRPWSDGRAHRRQCERHQRRARCEAAGGELTTGRTVKLRAASC